ncbi:hypothetical protein FZI85_04310 [Mycobacterium sp. CBMA293]|uniref:Kelch repeat-containing protein n=1 Tax=unclassified Mycolicibacterium TaxID=2636767 RepID=UPI0012DBCC84|nr:MULTISPECIES: hypothetical protein [unclassified Mycolicibacterium]MUL49800.1 hypothetical protein [Mycolicibacterium sp. CBMA 360]MUL58535.1 hypothetical protein [Mycolicibacterium sp. CBMA 335]MUL73993.1 hypothetical protein [Mycolicibacterium sp. CBMA 311]MUL93418.1 hypothetical protein [Mycolicibacterium sp. CBMA 230]MUM04633.1 hypothetical protein [Mycolicibacterium sp. CBMA 213]
MSWIEEEPLPTSRRGAGAARCDAPGQEAGELVYAIGGFGVSALVPEVDAYDTLHQTWATTVTTLPTPRSGLAVTATPGRLHALGGWSALTTAPEALHEVFEPTTMSWTQAAPLPTARAALGAATGPDGFVYAIGGVDANDNTVAVVEAYDPTTDTWSARAPLPTARMYLAVVTGKDGLIYAIGGMNNAAPAPSTAVEVFNTKTDTWTSAAAALPVGTCGLAAAVDPNGLIYAIGGNIVVNKAPVTVPNVYSYNPTSPAWTAQPMMAAPRAIIATTTGPDGLIYAMGGNGSATADTAFEAYTADKCYPIEHQIALLSDQISQEVETLGELPPQLRVGAEKQIARQREQVLVLEQELKRCRGQ